MPPQFVQAQYDTLQSIAKELRRQSTEIQQLERLLKSRMETLQHGGWKSQGADAFYREMEGEVLPALARLDNALAAGGDVVETLGRLFQTAEQEAARLFAGDGTGTTSGGSPTSGTGSTSVESGKSQTEAGSGDTGAPQQGGDGRPNLADEFERFRNERKPYTSPMVGYPRGLPGWLAEQVGLHRDDITEQEANLLDELRGPLGLNWGNVKKMQDVHDEAFAVEERYFGANSNNDGLGDAFRHAYWSARLTQEFGADWAKRFTDAHESRPGNQAARDFMDRWNNGVGIRIAQENPNASPDELANLIAAAVRDGQCVYIPGADQYPLRAPERNILAENGPLAYTDQDGQAPNIPNLPVEDGGGNTSDGGDPNAS